MTTENTNISSIIEQIKASQQKVLQAFENHNSLVNKSLEKLQQLKTETKVEVVKVRDPLEELKKVRDEFDKNVLTDTDLEPIKTSSKKWLETTYENHPKNICRSIGWIERIIFKNCQNIKSVSLHFQLFKDEITFKYSLDENSNECILYFGSHYSSRIIYDNTGPEAPDTIHTSMFPINILPYQPIYFTCEKIDETKPCYATMIYGYYDIVVPFKLVKNRIRFTIQDKKLFIRAGACDPDENLDLVNYNTIVKKQGEYLRKIIDILCLYETSKISTSFKEIFLKLFKTILDANNQGNINQIKERILTVRDIRWLLLEMEKYPQYFQFTEDDLTFMKENGASRDNIYLVKKFLKKDGDYEEYYPEEEGGGIKLQYHMSGGHLEGEYKEYYPNGSKKAIRNYKDGQPSGITETWYENGIRSVYAEYNKGLMSGVYNAWYENGNKLYETNHLYNKRHGVRKDYYPNGQLSMIKNYINGVQVGEYKHWYEDGKISLDVIYRDDGKLIKSEHWNQSGILTLKKSLIKFDTYELTRYYEGDGKVHDQVIMVGDKWNGEYNSWWHNGNKCIETAYKDDKIHGDYLYWNEDGTLKEKLFYKDGEKQV